VNGDFSQLWELMTPEELEQLLGLGTLDERQQMLGHQMAQAELLRQPSNKHYSTGWGAALGGLADVVRAGQGQYQLEQAQQGMEDILGKKDAGRVAYGELLQRFAQQQAKQNQPPTPDIAPPIPFSF